MKVLVATEKPFAAVAVDGIRKVIEEADYELMLLEKYQDKQQLLDAVADVDALIVRSDKVDAAVLDASKKLKIVVRAGAGCDENTPGQNSNAVAELVFGMAVMAVRNGYNGTSGSELKEKSLGIHAFGQVGRNVARIAKGFGMEVSALGGGEDGGRSETGARPEIALCRQQDRIASYSRYRRHPPVGRPRADNADAQRGSADQYRPQGGD